MIKHKFFQLLKNINIEILLILLLIVVLVTLLFYNNAKMENMTINIYADGKDYKINELKEEKKNTSNVKPYTKNNNDASDYPSELKEITPNTIQSKSNENTSTLKKEAKENTDAKKETDDAIAKRTSKYIDTFTGPITAEPPP